VERNKGASPVCPQFLKIQKKKWAVAVGTGIVIIGGCWETLGVGCALGAGGGGLLGGVTISDYNEQQNVIFEDMTNQLTAAGCNYSTGTTYSW
jgi:hypothetical protein